MDHTSVRTRIVGLRRLTPSVIEIELADPRAELPTWSPGAHLEVVLPSGLLRQYSLVARRCDRPGTLVVAVLLEEGGRGGSRELHAIASLDRELEVRALRNHFELSAATSYCFVAGGIGVTPMIAMARHAAARGAAWQLHYAGRSREHMPYAADLLAEFGERRVHLWPKDEGRRPDVAGIVAALEPGTLVYSCGPERLMRAVQESTRAAGLDCRVERFGAPAGEGAPLVSPPADGDGTFVVELRRAGLELKVPVDRSLLEVVQEAVPGLPSSCEEGFCGTCETRVLAGEPDHRDLVWGDDEKPTGSMMICVSRARSPRLVLDL